MANVQGPAMPPSAMPAHRSPDPTLYVQFETPVASGGKGTDTRKPPDAITTSLPSSQQGPGNVSPRKQTAGNGLQPQKSVDPAPRSPRVRKGSGQALPATLHQLAVECPDWVEEPVDKEAQAQLDGELRETTVSGFSTIGGLARLRTVTGDKGLLDLWRQEAHKIAANIAARNMRSAARLKALQRTPYAMVLARTKTLLERMAVIGVEAAAAARSTSPTGRRTTNSRSPTPVSKTKLSRMDSMNRSRSPNNALASQDSNGRERTGSHGEATTQPGGFSRIGSSNMMGGDMSVATSSSLEATVEELSLTLSYVSEFLRKMPEETRLAVCFAAHMENYKQHQHVYVPGDVADKFYIILTGCVEIWTHPPGNRSQKTVIATLRKGQSFGDVAILNQEPRAEIATPASNCTFLTVHKSHFMSIFSRHFEQQYQQAERFFGEHVNIFQKLPKDQLSWIVRHMLTSHCKAGRDWEPLQEHQIYFVRSGTLILEALDKKFLDSPGDTRRFAADGSEAPALSDSGPLANVVVCDGRAVGSLGHAEELQRRRRALVPRKVIAQLEGGAHFGGGPRLLGEGDLQSCLKVVAQTDVVLYHMHVESFFKLAGPEVVRAFRDDVSFKLTYYYGRLGTITHDTIIGHRDASLLAASTSKTPREEPSTARSGLSTKTPRQRKGKKVTSHVMGEVSSEVKRIMASMADMQSQLDGQMTDKSLDMFVNGTPAERFWSSAALSGTQRQAAMVPLLNTVYPSGLAPLTHKLDELINRTITRAPESIATLAKVLSPPTSPPSAQTHRSIFHPSMDEPRQTAYETQQSFQGCEHIPQENPTTPRLTTHASSRGLKIAIPGVLQEFEPCHQSPSSASPTQQSNSHPGYPAHAEQHSRSMSIKQKAGGNLNSSISPNHVPAYAWGAQTGTDSAGYGGPTPRQWAAEKGPPGSLTAASVIWRGLSDSTHCPGLRQVLTYDEIKKIKDDLKAPSTTAATASHGPSCPPPSPAKTPGSPRKLQHALSGSVPKHEGRKTFVGSPRMSRFGAEG